jgi:hypothetical protein
LGIYLIGKESNQLIVKSSKSQAAGGFGFTWLRRAGLAGGGIIKGDSTMNRLSILCPDLIFAKLILFEYYLPHRKQRYGKHPPNNYDWYPCVVTLVSPGHEIFGMLAMMRNRHKHIR